MRELEEKRINKEMAHIRQKFKGASTVPVETRGHGREWSRPVSQSC